MAVSVEATVGGASANSFILVADADTYLETRLNASAWSDAAAGDDQEKALIEATRELNLLPWVGVRVTDTQALSWPRDYAPDPDATLSDPDADYPYYAKDVIPQRVLDATCELALEFLKAGTSDLAALPDDVGIKSERVGPISTTYTNGGKPRGIARFPRIVTLLAPLLEGSGRLVRT